MAIEKVNPMMSPLKVRVVARMVSKSLRASGSNAIHLLRTDAPNRNDSHSAKNDSANNSRGWSNTPCICGCSGLMTTGATRSDGLFGFLPAGVWIELVDFGRDTCGVRAHILFVYHAVLVHHETHDSAAAVNGGNCQQRKTAAHF